MNPFPSYQQYSMYKLIGSVWAKDMTHKNLILEPLSCVVKIILLLYKPEGTKISLSNNGISYSYPSYIQGVFRGAYGDRREDIHNLYHPLCQALRWYDPNNKTYKILYSECHRGLQRLKEVYEKNSTIHHTINHYLALLEDPKLMDKDSNHGAIRAPVSDGPDSDGPDSDGVPDIDGDSDSEMYSDADANIGSLEQANPIIGHLRNIWSRNELTVIYDIVILLQTCAEHKRETYCRTLEDIVVAKETELCQYIQKVSTTY